jgi:hypothetical protein
LVDGREVVATSIAEVSGRAGPTLGDAITISGLNRVLLAPE